MVNFLSGEPREVRNILSLVLENVPQGIALYDYSGKLIYSNSSFHLLTGIAPSAANLPEQLLELISRCKSTGKEIEKEIRFDSSLSSVEAEARIAPIHSPNLPLPFFLLDIHDVTRLKQLEKMRQDFVANVSHELRTPVTSIRGAAETLLEGALEDRTNARRFTDIIFRQSERLSRIIEDLLSLSRIEQGNDPSEMGFEEHELGSIVLGAIKNCEPRAVESGIRLQCESKGDSRGLVNRTLLEQAIGNLIDNALEHSPSGSTVYVTLDVESSIARIKVRDEGCGIEQHHLPRLFERFYRVDKSRNRKFGGTGLGLAIVKHVAIAHKGKVSVKSEVGQGSEFVIEIPLNRRD